jgi:hypothetical protein
MENVKELEPSELLKISGGVNLAYEIGYVAGRFVRNFILAKSIFTMFS